MLADRYEQLQGHHHYFVFRAVAAPPRGGTEVKVNIQASRPPLRLSQPSVSAEFEQHAPATQTDVNSHKELQHAHASQIDVSLHTRRDAAFTSTTSA